MTTSGSVPLMFDTARVREKHMTCADNCRCQEPASAPRSSTPHSNEESTVQSEPGSLVTEFVTPRPLESLLERNRDWAQAVEDREPGFFRALQGQQAPKYLWIGCADSRVPANELVGLQPGELFVHRNVANVVAHSDLNCLAVLQYAVDQLRVEHIIVVGHSGCGGVQAALMGARIGVADNWIRHVSDVLRLHDSWFDKVPEAQRLDTLCELNVLEQALNVCGTTVVRDAWRRGQALVVHAWIYGLHNGWLRDLQFSVSDECDANSAHGIAIERLKLRRI